MAAERSVNRVLIVDDDTAISRTLTMIAEASGYEAVSVDGTAVMRDQLAICQPSLVILDLPLAQEDGLDLLREIRSHSDVPVIITTGHRRDEIDRVVGL